MSRTDMDKLSERIPKRAVPKKYDEKIGINDDDYKKFIVVNDTFEISCDIRLYNYDQALSVNRYIEKNNPGLSLRVFAIGNTGQGDQWFMDKKTSSILFYDHNDGELNDDSTFSDMKTVFVDFLQAALIINDFENENVSVEEMKEKLTEINPDFLELYPFYF